MTYAQQTAENFQVHLPWWVFVVLAVIAVLTAWGISEGLRTGTTRDRALAHGAKGRGWLHVPNDPVGLGDLRFRTFAGAKHAKVTNVLTSDAGRGRVRIFDYSLMFEQAVADNNLTFVAFMADDLFGVDSNDKQKNQKLYTKRRTGAVVRVDAFLPALSAKPSSLLTRAFEGMGATDIDFESVEFNREWDVRCADARFAYLFCDVSMIDLIVSLGRGLSIETFGNYVLFTRPLLTDATEVFAFGERIAAVPKILNPLIAAEYPTVTEMEARAMADSWTNRPNGRNGVF